MKKDTKNKGKSGSRRKAGSHDNAPLGKWELERQLSGFIPIRNIILETYLACTNFFQSQFTC